MTPYECYSLHNALRLHFTSPKYDYVKYHGKTRTTREGFERNRMRFFYQKLAKKYNNDDQMKDFLIANLSQERIFISDLLAEEADETFRAYVKRKQSLSYTFDTQLEKAFKDLDSPSLLIKMFRPYPLIVSLYLLGDLTIETLVIVNDLVGFRSAYDDFLGKDDVLWGKIRMQMDKIKPFMEYDKEKMKIIFKKHLTPAS